VEEVRGGFKGLEGPVAAPDGGLFFNDIPANITYKLNRTARLPSGVRTRTAPTACSSRATAGCSPPKAQAGVSSR
jgi:hypothetical protein